MGKKLIISVFLTVFLAINAQATMVSLFVIETGLPQEGAKNLHSQKWENAFFEVFFDAGLILCNAPMLRFESAPGRDIEYFAQEEMDEARQGGSEFFIIAQLNYPSGGSRPGDISIAMYDLDSAKKIHERKLTGKTYRNENEEISDLKTIIRGLVPLLSQR
jgi:hypothetical protein